MMLNQNVLHSLVLQEIFARNFKNTLIDRTVHKRIDNTDIRKFLATYFATTFFWSFTFNKMIFSTIPFIEFFKNIFGK